MKNELIKYQENIFVRLKSFLKRLFKRKNRKINIEEKDCEEIKQQEEKSKFVEDLEFYETTEEISIKKLQQQFENGEIDEDDMTDEEVDKLVELYNKQTEELVKDTMQRKKHIEYMLNEMKKVNS